MKRISFYRMMAACFVGALMSWVWILASAQWAIHIEFSLLFPALRHATGLNGPWMVGVGDILFAVTSASVVALLAVIALRPFWWQATAMFLVGFCGAQIILGTFAGNSLAFLATYDPLRLFVAWFALSSSVLSRLFDRIGSNESFKPNFAEAKQVIAEPRQSFTHKEGES